VTEPAASGTGGGLAPVGRTAAGPPWPVIGIVAGLLVMVVAMLAVLFVFQSRHNPNAVLKRTALVNQLPPKGPLNAATAGPAVLAFWGFGDQETIAQALANAAGYPTGGTPTLPVRYVVRPTAGGYRVTVSLKVNVRQLIRTGAIATGTQLPGASDPATGDLEVNAYDGHEYDISDNPRTDVSQFIFRISGSGKKLWAVNANAIAVMGQNESFNSMSL
jgi:hypothetical protein